VSGAILQMISHGISTGALFILVGVIYDRRHTRDLADFGGLAKVMPAYATLFVIVAMSSVGLPGTNGFVGEFMVLSGTFVSRNLGLWPKTFTLFAATGVILAAIYMLHAVLKTFWGPLDNEKNQNLTDLTTRERWILAPLIVGKLGSVEMLGGLLAGSLAAGVMMDFDLIGNSKYSTAPADRRGSRGPVPNPLPAPGLDRFHHPDFSFLISDTWYPPHHPAPYPAIVSPPETLITWPVM